jgi:hypothetical protein
MLLIEEDLIDALGQKDIPANKRILTDWRRKHYLPPLQSKGLGRGQGKTYFWPDVGVIDRAALVDELLCEGFRGTRVNVVLWLFGYDVPLYVVRERLQTGLEKFERVLTGGNRTAGEIEDNISQFVSNYFGIAGRLNGRFPGLGLPTHQRPEEMEMFFNLLVNPGYDLHDAPFEEGALAAAERSKAEAEDQSVGSTEEPAKSLEELRVQWSFFRQCFSLPKLKAALAWAGDVELLRAREDVCGIFRAVGKLLGGMPEAEQLRPARLNAAYMLGSTMILIDLSFRHSGLGELVDAGLAKVHEHLKQLTASV